MYTVSLVYMLFSGYVLFGFSCFIISQRKHCTVFDIFSCTFYSLIRIFPRFLWKTFKGDFIVFTHVNVKSKHLDVKIQLNFKKKSSLVGAKNVWPGREAENYPPDDTKQFTVRCNNQAIHWQARAPPANKSQQIPQDFHTNNRSGVQCKPTGLRLGMKRLVFS